MADPIEGERSYPFSGGPGAYVTEDDWAAMAQTLQDSGVYGHPGTSDLKVRPGTDPGTIQIDPGPAGIGGFHYLLTVPKVLTTTPNSGTAPRTDLVVLHLDRASMHIVAEILDNTTVLSIPGDEFIPLAEWDQLPSSQTTPTNWGTATDRRWFMGARMRPTTTGTTPPATPGGFLYRPEEGPSGKVYVGDVDGAGAPYWKEWRPWERDIAIEGPVMVTTESDATTTSTTFVPTTSVLSTSFTAPPSGQVLITVFAQVECVSPSTGFCGYEVRENDVNGTIIAVPEERYSAANQDQFFSGSERRRLLKGLTPGEIYYVRTMLKASTAVTASAFTRSLLIEPVLIDGPADVVPTGSGPDPNYLPADYGLSAWNGDPGYLVSGIAPTAGAVRLLKIKVPTAMTIANIVLFMKGATMALTSGQNFVALYDMAGNRVAVSADQTANWMTAATASGAKLTCPLTAPYSAPAGFIYAAFLINGTAMPNMGRYGQIADFGNVGLTSVRFGIFGSGLTATPTSIAPSSIVTDPTMSLWAGVS